MYSLPDNHDDKFSPFSLEHFQQVFSSTFDQKHLESADHIPLSSTSAFSHKQANQKIHTDEVFLKRHFDKLQSILKKNRISYNDFLTLLRPESSMHLQKIAKKTQEITVQRFGKTIYFYTPLYLSNECESNCIYCGFSKNRKFERVSLSINEIKENFEILKDKGFDNILLVTGDSRKSFGVKKIKEAVTLAKKYFSFVGIEVFPMSYEEYKDIVSAGCDGITLYQETYDKEIYSKMHLAGEKKNYSFRLNAPENALKAGFRKLGIGSLLGLGNPLYEAACLGAHAHYLQKKYWKSEITISFPRIRPENILSKVPFPVSDKSLVQIICALRIFLPETGMVLSTRENPSLRDNLIDIAITQVSAGSKTNPGGYSKTNAKEQFFVSDQRELNEMIEVIRQKGFDTVIKDWSKTFAPVKH